MWIEIAAQLRSRHKNVYFLVVGDGVLHDDIHAKAAELHTQDYLFFAGLQQDVKPFLKAMDIFMMCSEFEGLPIALLEAMSMECLPACTAAGGIPELVQHESNGILVPVNEPKKLIDELNKCLQDRDKMTALQSSARRTVVNSYGMKKMVDEIETLYNVVLNSKSE
jgi:glycosyltransferase involved in cell wall biosynthesis